MEWVMSEQAKKTNRDSELERTPFGTIEYRTHSDDLTLDLRGHSAEDLFQLATWGLARVQFLKWPEECTVEERVELVSDDWDDEIVNWLNQLIFLSEKHRAFWTDVKFEELDENRLKAVVKGRAWPENPKAIRQEVKAASYFGIEFIPGPSLWQARVTLEI
jgi:SHS2 domain-containing protein